MIAKLIGWSARNLVLILFATAVAVAGGIYAIRTLPLEGSDAGGGRIVR